MTARIALLAQCRVERRGACYLLTRDGSVVTYAARYVMAATLDALPDGEVRAYVEGVFSCGTIVG